MRHYLKASGVVAVGILGLQAASAQSADKPWRIDLLPPEATTQEMVTFDDWLASLDLLAGDLDAEHITETNSGHDIYLYRPALVVDAIRTVVDDVRSGEG